MASVHLILNILGAAVSEIEDAQFNPCKSTSSERVACNDRDKAPFY